MKKITATQTPCAHCETVRFGFKASALAGIDAGTTVHIFKVDGAGYVKAPGRVLRRQIGQVKNASPNFEVCFKVLDVRPFAVPNPSDSASMSYCPHDGQGVILANNRRYSVQVKHETR